MWTANQSHINWVWCVAAHTALRQCKDVLLDQIPTLLDYCRLRRFNADVPLDKLTIIGAGLLGGSIGRAAQSKGLAKRVAALVRRPESVAECLAIGIANEVTLDPEEAVDGAELVVICTPISGMAGLIRGILPALEPGVTITDVGSTKKRLVSKLTPLCEKAGVHFIGSHPMAGSEQTGPAAARANLFDDAICVITPTDNTDTGALVMVKRFWTDLGLHPVEMAPDLHDHLVARSSHLPHLLASTLTENVLNRTHSEQQARLCATGFRDMTRLAAGSPAIWRDIVSSNRDDILAAIDEFTEDLGRLRRLIAEDSMEKIEEWLQDTKTIRDNWSHSTDND